MSLGILIKMTFETLTKLIQKKGKIHFFPIQNPGYAIDLCSYLIRIISFKVA